jgi:uncharacterized membrane protein
MTATSPGTLLRSIALGAAVGGRTTAGPAALALSSRATDRRRRQLLAGVALSGELVGDTLPRTPSRDEPAGLIGRGGSSLACGATLARRRGEAAVPAALAAIAGAAAGIQAGLWWRREGADRLGVPALAAALLEDAFVLGLAAVACRGT